jgi:predicted dehydrogenase
MLALKAGRHVVCEKPLTVNASQATVLYKTAREKQLFLLDAVWTRYFPLSIEIRESIRTGEIGEVLRVIADTSFGIHPDIALRETPRKLTHHLAGGALLESSSTHTHPTRHELELQTLTSNAAFSWYLFSHMGVPDPLPHAATRSTQATVKHPVIHEQV